MKMLSLQVLFQYESALIIIIFKQLYSMYYSSSDLIDRQSGSMVSVDPGQPGAQFNLRTWKLVRCGES